MLNISIEIWRQSFNILTYKNLHRDTDEGTISQLGMSWCFVHCKSSCIAGNLFDPESHHLSISENDFCWKITKNSSNKLENKRVQRNW